LTPYRSYRALAGDCARTRQTDGGARLPPPPPLLGWLPRAGPKRPGGPILCAAGAADRHAAQVWRWLLWLWCRRGPVVATTIRSSLSLCQRRRLLTQERFALFKSVDQTSCCPSAVLGPRRAPSPRRRSDILSAPDVT
jgi:hypothetical protein